MGGKKYIVLNGFELDLCDIVEWLVEEFVGFECFDYFCVLFVLINGMC